MKEIYCPWAPLGLLWRRSHGLPMVRKRTTVLRLFFVVPVLAGAVFAERLWPQVGPTTSGILTMKGAAEQAIAVSPDLRSLEAQQIVKEGAWALGFRAFLPKLSLSASENDRLSTIGADSFTKTYTISLQQMLWDGGRLLASRKLEKAELNLSRMDLRRKASDIGESAINLYRTIMYKEAVLEIKKATLTALELQNSILEEEVRHGLALQTDLDEASLNLEDARLNIESLYLDLETARLDLALLLGLENIPFLADHIDANRSSLIKRPLREGLVFRLGQLAAEVHPDLVRERSAIQKLQVQVQSSERAWWPTLKLSGDLSLLGDRYPLSRYSYSLGLSLEFSGPFLSGSVGGKAGWEGSTDRTALVQSSAEPLPDPGSALSKGSLQAMLMMEQERYALLLKQVTQQIKRLVMACLAAEDRRLLAVKQAELARKKLGLLEVKHSLGQATTLEVMKARIESASQETAVVEAAVSLLQTERALETYLDLAPGELGDFIQNVQGILP